MENFDKTLLIFAVIIVQAAVFAGAILFSIYQYKKYWKNGSIFRKWLLIFSDTLFLCIIVAGYRGLLN